MKPILTKQANINTSHPQGKSVPIVAMPDVSPYPSLVSSLSKSLLSLSLILISLTGCDNLVQVKEKPHTETTDSMTEMSQENTINLTKAHDSHDLQDESGINDEPIKESHNDLATDVVAGRLLRIATEGTYPPFNYTNADGSLAGLDVDVAKTLCDQMKAECQIVVQDWDNIISGLQAKKYDAIISAMSVTPERLKVVDFTEPYYKSTLVWVAPQGSEFNPKKAKNMTLGSQRSTTIGAYLLSSYNMNQGNKVNLYDDYHNAYSDLRSGRNDAILAEKVNAQTWLTANPNFTIIGEEIDNNDTIAIAVRKGDALGAKFNQALKNIRETGLLEKIKTLNLGDDSLLQTTMVTPVLVEPSAKKLALSTKKDVESKSDMKSEINLEASLEEKQDTKLEEKQEEKTKVDKPKLTKDN